MCYHFKFFTDVARRDSHEKLKMIVTEKFILTIKFYTHFLETQKWARGDRNSSDFDPPLKRGPPPRGGPGGQTRNCLLHRKGFCQGGPQPPFLVIFGHFGQKMVGVSKISPFLDPQKSWQKNHFWHRHNSEKNFSPNRKVIFQLLKLQAALKFLRGRFKTFFVSCSESKKHFGR